MFEMLVCLQAQPSFLFDATDEQRPGFMQLPAAAWCRALPGKPLSSGTGWQHRTCVSLSQRPYTRIQSLGALIAPTPHRVFAAMTHTVSSPAVQSPMQSCLPVVHCPHPPAGAAASMQWKGRPLVYDGSRENLMSFASQDVVGEVCARYAASAGRCVCEEEGGLLGPNDGPSRFLLLLVWSATEAWHGCSSHCSSSSTPSNVSRCLAVEASCIKNHNCTSHAACSADSGHRACHAPVETSSCFCCCCWCRRHVPPGAHGLHGRSPGRSSSRHAVGLQALGAAADAAAWPTCLQCYWRGPS